MMTATISASLDGITTLPVRHVATIKTYLQRQALPAFPRRPDPAGISLLRMTGKNEARYQSIFATLGKEWLWWSRMMLSAEAISSILDDQNVLAYAVQENGRDIGLMELDFREKGCEELAFLGLFKGCTGKGIGPWLMGEALEIAFSHHALDQIQVNTCTLDHPGALGFYRSCGFTPIRQAVEIVPDPRLSGLLALDAAPHIPIILD